MVKSLLAIMILTLLVAYTDARGFIHASRIWTGDGITHWSEAARSGLYFILGIPVYWLVLRYLGLHGIRSAELQAAIWFLATMVGLALLSGKFFAWNRLDQAVALVVCAGLLWLVIRVEG